MNKKFTEFVLRYRFPLEIVGLTFIFVGLAQIFKNLISSHPLGPYVFVIIYVLNVIALKIFDNKFVRRDK